MNTDTILKSTLRSWIQEQIRLSALTELSLIPGMQGWVNIHKSLRVIQHITQPKEREPTWTPLLMHKTPSTEFSWLHGKSPEETRSNRNTPQQNEAYRWQTHGQQYAKRGEMNRFLYILGRDRMSTPFTLTQGCAWSLGESISQGKRNVNERIEVIILSPDSMTLKVPWRNS